MSLLSDLQSLDLSGIVDAKAQISVSVGTDDFAAMVSGGAAVTALGDFGVTLRDLQGSLDDPAVFARPLLEAIGPLQSFLAPDLEVFGRYRTAVEEGANVLGGLLSTLDADPALFGQAFGRSLGDSFGTAAAMAEKYLPIDLDDLTDLRALDRPRRRRDPDRAGPARRAGPRRAGAVLARGPRPDPRQPRSAHRRRRRGPARHDALGAARRRVRRRRRGAHPTATPGRPREGRLGKGLGPRARSRPRSTHSIRPSDRSRSTTCWRRSRRSAGRSGAASRTSSATSRRGGATSPGRAR